MRLYCTQRLDAATQKPPPLVRCPVTARTSLRACVRAPRVSMPPQAHTRARTQVVEPAHGNDGLGRVPCEVHGLARKVNRRHVGRRLGLGGGAVALSGRAGGLDDHVVAAGAVVQVQQVGVAAGGKVLAVGRDDALKLVENAVVFVQVAQLGPQVLVDLNRLHRPRLHLDVPNLERQVVARHNIASVRGELDVGNACDNL